MTKCSFLVESEENMQKKYQLTPKGKSELEAELQALIAGRSELSEKIAEAREHGDLRENAEYDAARTKQAVAETRIAEIEDILQNAQYIKASNNGVVGLGSVVTLENPAKTVKYEIVGAVEANPLEGKMSNESPLGVALLGKKQGEKVTVKTPKGETEYTIVTVE